MPDGSERSRRRDMGAAGSAAGQQVGGIERDPVDVRDRFYEPTLQPLKPVLLPDPFLLAELRKPSGWMLPRFQGEEGSCGGQALSALIDYERIRAGVTPPLPCSPRMIQEMARVKVGALDLDAGVSLRDVIKSFYNYGVCSEEKWRYRVARMPPEPRDPGRDADEEARRTYAQAYTAFEIERDRVQGLREGLTVERARQAKEISLGAYYRLRPNLNTCHAALVETGGLLVSAELHDGWQLAATSGRAGVIGAGGYAVFRGECHAFAVVGYTRQGFLVLNSWGRDWGGWAPTREEFVIGTGREPEPGALGPIPGLALWRYEDWAASVIDGWALRLGVGAAEAFEYSIGDQGLGFGIDREVRSTPVHAVLGRFLHLDDGNYVTSGAYVSTGRTLTETHRLLKAKATGVRVGDDGLITRGAPEIRGILLTFAGSLYGLREAAAEVARQKKMVSASWYPFTILWSVDYVEQARSVLDGVFRSAAERAGRPGRRLDEEIEQQAHGVGRAFWRDIQCAARQAARVGGPLHDLVRAAAELSREAPGLAIRVVTESEGAFALAALAFSLHTQGFRGEAQAVFEMLESVDLIAPPMTDDEMAALVHYLNTGWGPDRPHRRIVVHLPGVEDERRLTVPPYGRSYFELVRRAFATRDDRPPRQVEIAPSRRAPTDVAAKWDGWRDMPRVTLEPIELDATRRRQPAAGADGSGDGGHSGARRDRRGVLTQTELLYHSDVAGRLQTVTGRHRPKDRPARNR